VQVLCRIGKQDNVNGAAFSLLLVAAKRFDVLLDVLKEESLLGVIQTDTIPARDSIRQINGYYPGKG
jgi:hypothetical protein